MERHNRARYVESEPTLMEPHNRARYVESEPTINRKAHFFIEGGAEALG